MDAPLNSDIFIKEDDFETFEDYIAAVDEAI